MAVEVINTRYEVLETFRSPDSSPYIVYKARDVQEGRIVTLKVVPSSLAAKQPDLLPRLRSAVREVDALDHPMISRTYDAGQMPTGDVYLVTDYVRGITLRERIRRIAPFALAVATDIAVAIAEALAAAHRSGITHGRLLPESVVLSPEGQIRVGEFVAGRLMHDVVPNAEAISAAYRPPEAAFDEEPAPTDDIYALGAILYEMLTGVQPTESHGDLPTPPRALNPGIPPALEGITLKALYPDTTIRYEDAAALLADLQAARAALRAGRPLTWSPLSGVKPEKASRPVDGVRTPRVSAAKREPEYDDADEKSEREPPGALAIAIRVAFIVALIGVVALGWFFYKFLSPPPDITVPNLIGRTMDDAQAIGQEKHFIPKDVHDDFSTKWPEGQIYSQDPPAGQTIKAGQQVNVYVSEGPQFIVVPDVVGMTADKARRTIQDSTLQIGTIDEDYSETVPTGVIIKQTPTAHTNVARDASVGFTLSKGKQPPDTPVNVVANPIGSDHVEVTWQPAARAQSYQVTRIVDGTMTVVAQADKDTKFEDTGLTPDTQYTYTVMAINAVGDSPASDPSAPAFTPPADTGAESGTTSITVTPGTSAPDGSTGSPATPSNGGPTTPSSSTDGASAPEQSDSSSSSPAQPSTSAPASASPPDSDSSETRQRLFRISFRVPRSPRGDHRVRFEVTDSTGTSLVYDEMHHSGDYISVPEKGFGSKVMFRIYLDDALMKQQTL